MNKLTRWLAVNALDFGADPTRRENCTAALRQAMRCADKRFGWLPSWLRLGRLPGLRSLVRARRTVYLPAGNYVVTLESIVPLDVTLRGD